MTAIYKDAKRQRLFWIWADMKSRCTNKNHRAYKNYGARGLTISPQWNDFSAFERDMGYPPKDFSIERVDNEKGYSRENCEWADRKTQNNNRRHCIYVRIGDEKLSLKQAWEKHAHPSVTYRSLHKRFTNRNWAIEDALKIPARGCI